MAEDISRVELLNGSKELLLAKEFMELCCGTACCSWSRVL